ncbi:MAG: peptidoglycan bridge formation glycyltransferase FemA/FemB family protein [Parcubacteria group bacterium]|nr:peptidoglycan bridge formation glycyltransferase FemA/FemB family protein [Parcubacteria group bacterium]
MKIVEVNQENKQEVEGFLKLQKASLLQSFHWGEFQESLERKKWHFIILNENNIIASVLLVKYNLPLGKSYLYCNRGPILLDRNGEALNLILKKVKEIANQEDSIFYRIDPEWSNKEDEELLNKLEFKKSKKEINPKNTLILNISESEEEILAQMHSKTRYNIRLATRKGVKVRISDGNNKDFEAFWKLMKETTERDGFSSHPGEYYKKQLEFFNKDSLVKLFITEVGSEVVSAIVVSFYNDNAVYLHGASGYEHRKYMAPHLIQWEAIKEAKRRGCIYYDFWGIEGENQESRIKNQDWGGITRFKKGFAREFGVEKNYIGAWDLPLQKMWYGVYNLMRK